MSAGIGTRSFEPFFLSATAGRRFCILHPAVGTNRGAILYLHPFAEEMNKSRRMAALQSRAFAAQGFTVLQIDLCGCGDSDGEFGQATWESWKDDVRHAIDWLRGNGHLVVTVWGLRAGALLALDAVRDHASVTGFVLWQPVLNGETMLTQFLRIQIAGEMLAESRATLSVDQLRAALASGSALEIAGYELCRELAASIDKLKLKDLAPRGGRVQWFEIVPAQGRDLPPAARRVVDTWTNEGVDLDVHCVPGEPFWSTPEISECAALIAQTTDAFVGPNR